MADFWDSLTGDQPGAVAAPTQTFATPEQINALYQQYYNRPATPYEITNAQGNPGGASAIEALMVADTAKPTTGAQFGAIPAPFTPSAAATSFQTYAAPQFTEAAPNFTAPTVADVANDPFVQYGEQRAIRAQQNAAAAKGTVLNAQTQAALGRDLTDYTAGQVGNVFGRANQTFQNALATYGAKYNVFAGNADRATAATAANNAVTQQRFGNEATTYGVNQAVNEQAQTDYWQRLMDQARLGASAAAA